MAIVEFTSALQRFFPELEPTTVEVETVADIVEVLGDKYPGLRDYLVEEDGRLRKHVNIFLEEKMISDRKGLSDNVTGVNRVLIFQALSGG